MKKNELERNSIKPLYSQIYDKLYDMITNGTISPGDKIPSEVQLANIFNVSRVTIRKTISVMKNEGLLESLAGKGTFIAEPKIDRELVDVSSFTNRMEKVGKSSHSKVISISIFDDPPIKIKHELLLNDGDKVIEINRVRYTEKEPICIERSKLSLARFPGLEKLNFENQSLYKLLEQNYNIRPVRSHKSLELTACNAEEAKFLGTLQGSSMFLIRATIFSNEFPIEYVKILLKGNRFRFLIK